MQRAKCCRLSSGRCLRDNEIRQPNAHGARIALGRIFYYLHRSRRSFRIPISADASSGEYARRRRTAHSAIAQRRGPRVALARSDMSRSALASSFAPISRWTDL